VNTSPHAPTAPVAADICDSPAPRPPTISVAPASRLLEAADAAGAVATLAVTLDDDVTAVGLSYSCAVDGTVIGNGSLAQPNVTYRFPLGNSSVVCTATDCKGNTASSSPALIQVADTTAPTLNVTGPASRIEATSAAGATVRWTPTASDGVSATSAIQVTCGNATQPAGSEFVATLPLGSTTVSCSAVDASGNAAPAASFTVTVADTTPPALDVSGPAGAVEATSDAGAVVTWTPAATDAVSGAADISVTCGNTTQAAGTAFSATFPLGATTVSCSAADGAGNAAAAASFTVTVVDTTPPTVNVTGPASTVEATSAAGAAVRWTPSAGAGATQVTCGNATQPAGSEFVATLPLGSTTVSCSAVDASGNAAPAASFTVTVADTTPPALSSVPSDFTVDVNATGAPTASVSFSLPSASDLADPSPAVSCSPAPGAAFAVNVTTTVTCTARDAAGNSASASFKVTMRELAAPTNTSTPSGSGIPADDPAPPTAPGTNSSDEKMGLWVSGRARARALGDRGACGRGPGACGRRPRPPVCAAAVGAPPPSAPRFRLDEC
jgi:hypothetical protein